MGVRLGGAGGGGGGGGGAGGGGGGVLPARPGGGPAKVFPPLPSPPLPKIAAARSVPPRPVHPGARAGVGWYAAPRSASQRTQKNAPSLLRWVKGWMFMGRRCVSTARGGGALAREERVTKRIGAGRGVGVGGMGGGSGLAPYQRSERTKGAAGWVSWLKTCDRAGSGWVRREYYA